MTAVLVPRPYVAVRLPSVRAGLLLMVALPVLVAWGGADDDAVVRLRLAGAVVALVLALVWDDRAAALTASTPAGLPAVQRGRALVLVVVLATGWSLAAAAAVRTTGAVPVGPLALEAGGLSVLLCAVVGVLVRGRTGEPVGAYPVLGLLGLVAAQSRLPPDWSLLSTGPLDAEIRRHWVVVLVVGAAVLAGAARDPASRPLGAQRRATSGEPRPTNLESPP